MSGQAMQPIRDDLLEALAADARLDGHPAPSAVLARMLGTGGDSKVGRRRGSWRQDRAVLLAAIYVRLLRCMNSDLGEPPVVAPQRTRWKRLCRSGSVLVSASELGRLPLVSPDTDVLAIQTCRLLTQLPAAFVRDLVRWAPPVVSESPQSGVPMPVLGSILSAFLASQCLEGEPVRVCVLGTATRARFGAADLIGFGLPLLEPLVGAETRRIAAAAPNLRLAELLTGRKRAMAARMRQRVCT